MLKIKIISIGKCKESWLTDAIEEYIKRLSQEVTFDFVWVKNDAQLLNLAEKEQNVICLDPQGKQMSSEAFYTFIHQSGSRLTFIIGGPEGLPPPLKEKPLISLSLMTFTHQIARLILVEQIYRATEIHKGTKYHK